MTKFLLEFYKLALMQHLCYGIIDGNIDSLYMALNISIKLDNDDKVIELFNFLTAFTVSLIIRKSFVNLIVCVCDS